MKYDLNNLVVLKYGDNQCFTKVVDATGAELDGLEIFPDKGIWSHRGRKHEIGENKYIRISSSNEVIGVYDRTNTDHLSSMTYHAIRATEEKPGPLGY